MAIECGDLWQLANTLGGLSQNVAIDAKSREPLARAAINRAYYAGYHRALQHALFRGYAPPAAGEGSGHSALWRWYRAEGGTLRLIASLGFSTHDRRKVADYDLGMPCPSMLDQLEEVDQLADALEPFERAALGQPPLEGTSQPPA